MGGHHAALAARTAVAVDTAAIVAVCVKLVGILHLLTFAEVLPKLCGGLRLMMLLRVLVMLMLMLVGVVHMLRMVKLVVVMVWRGENVRMVVAR